MAPRSTLTIVLSYTEVLGSRLPDLTCPGTVLLNFSSHATLITKIGHQPRTWYPSSRRDRSIKYKFVANNGSFVATAACFKGHSLLNIA